MQLLVKPETLTLYIYIYIDYIYMDLRLDARSRLFLFAAQCFKIELTQKVFHVSQLCVNTLQATKNTLITNGT
jgi:hypothetical protein